MNASIIMKRNRRTLIVVLAPTLAIATLAAYFLFSHAVPLDRFDRITLGMTQGSVRDLLGTPDYVRHNDPGDAPWNKTVFFYGGFPAGKWCAMEIFFGTDDRVSQMFHDH
jgi:hypothetical protein